MKTKKLSIEARVDRALAVADPSRRLRLLAEIHAETMALGLTLRARKRDAILELRSFPDRKTWEEIGELLGVSAQRAEQLSR